MGYKLKVVSPDYAELFYTLAAKVIKSLNTQNEVSIISNTNSFSDVA